MALLPNISKEQHVLRNPSAEEQAALRWEAAAAELRCCGLSSEGALRPRGTAEMTQSRRVCPEGNGTA